ncbi:hypothetical protein FHG64_09515 [Antarcticibacterium flavum]|uniref:DUF4175 family protein n=1 Tax=Antarcticibacterium flavum TaxID=2058175 RepID=A0A5B7X292_9FLAO|nr:MULTISPECIES: hypothetical protein [Antarcticibacterium]MCM4159219.1 hypothetical protein [Antarcticibacterium sp. W02-3]QCY69616.1 hypothetical protein FHG64_09515 [Antarcticibacterium flavum]
MEDFNYIKKQLAAFTRKYYLNELLKGAILFFSIWLLYFLLVLFIEYFFWLSPPNRSILFWAFIAVSVALLIKFIVVPLSKLFKLSRGINELEASRIIGKHFPEVNDKLLNVLQLQQSGEHSDLLLAGIAQKSKELKPVPFKTAVTYRSSYRYFKYAAFPIIIILAVIITGNQAVFSESYSRVIHYKTAYEPPAPFNFNLQTDVLQVEEGNSFPLTVSTQGTMVPETVTIHFNNETYFLRTLENGMYDFVFQGVKEDVDFYLSANGVRSHTYTLEVLEVPRLLEFKLRMEYPGYLKRSSEIKKGSGNVIVPEGTNITWELDTRSTNEVIFSTRDTAESFRREGSKFSFTSSFFNNTKYQVTTSNEKLRDYESLDYSIEVIKDEFPQIEIQHKRDSINNGELYFFGKISDDHAVAGLNMVYYKGTTGEEAANRTAIPVSREVYNEFFYSFPGDLNLEKGENYSIYFEVYDNDGVNGAKRSRSETFSYREKAEEEIREEKIKQQGESINNLSQSLERIQLSEKELEEISRLQKEKEELNFNDRKKLENFLERQKSQNEMMKDYSQKLKESLQQEGQEDKGEFKKQLDERLQRNEERLKENEDLLEELQEYADKINREELSEKLEKLSKQNTNKQKSLEQLLELTKRYYVQEKTQKIARDLEKLGEKQEGMAAEDSTNTVEKQEELNRDFEEVIEKIEDVEKENASLKKPYDLERDIEEEKEISEKQESAGEQLKEENKEGARQEQKKAGEMMKKMAKKMQQAQMSAQGEQLNANIESLRQILSNLMVFSFEQEELLLNFRKLRPNDASYAGALRKQQVLKEHFQHVDDSLFALAMNNPMISDKITTKLTDIEFDIDKSLDRLAQNEIPQGTASQQYVMTGTNELALMLSDVLGNMQEMANPSMSPGGGGEEQQLSDIIMTQEELKKQMQEGLNEQEQQQGQEGEEGEEPQEREGGSESREGGSGQQEEMSGKLFEIFKQQQLLKQQLENRLKEAQGDTQQGELLQEMEQVEKDILNKGFNAQTLERMNRIIHKMLELEQATFEQEEDEERSSRTNTTNFENTAKDQNLKAREYFNSTEILNRQTLPLRQIYKAKVKQYFEAVEN